MRLHGCKLFQYRMLSVTLHCIHYPSGIQQCLNVYGLAWLPEVVSSMGSAQWQIANTSAYHSTVLVVQVYCDTERSL